MLMDGRGEANIEEIGAVAAMTTNDVLHTLQNLNMIKTSVSLDFFLWMEKAAWERD